MASRSPLPIHGSAIVPARHLVAHRAGNDLRQLALAERLGARLIEADVRLHLGRVEIRHLKTIGPLPILWDTWHLANPFAQRLQLHQLLEAIAPETELMLDLKGFDPRLSRKVLKALRARTSQQPVTICARSWRLLDRFDEEPGIRVVHSIGSRRALRRLLERTRGQRLGGVSIHERLLNSRTVAALIERTELLMTWPVNTPERAARLLDLGVHALITDEADALASFFASRNVAAAA